MEDLEDEMFADLIRLANEAQQNRIKEIPQQEPQACSIDNPECAACGS
jgi:hypothetical protein